MPDLLPPPLLSAGPFTLRPFHLGDATVVMEAGRDPLIPLVTTVQAGGNLQQAEAFIKRQHQRLSTGQGYSLAIANAQDQAIGQIGLWPAAQGRASIGYWVVSSQRRQGVAVQALRSISRWGLSLPELHRLELYIEPWNESSWRTAERAGYQREGLLRSWQTVGEKRRDMWMYSLIQHDPEC
ncbi:GNAT family protein [Deinococcus rubellus]|uniref:GNAT family N-acetyltransferase n=1 Tax=Deinococcus rubellus TaxID=1889240 RepID=A0ABY5YJ84_9DEIO|nr:GNAT family protein [Deinococcus rubellus]UWX63848.1 GNAT family N-acetyltransferase [Deinococcus rubellus]